MAIRKTTSLDEIYGRGRSFPNGGQARDPGARHRVEHEPDMTARDESRNQDVSDKHGPGYDNDASGWVRGAVGAPTGNNETATNYPGGNFDRGNAWRMKDKGISHSPDDTGQQRKPEPNKP